MCIRDSLKKFMYSSLPSLDLATADLYDIALLYTVKPESPGLGVTQELALDGKPSSPSVWKVPEEAMEVDEDRPHDPGEYDAVEAHPRNSRCHGGGVTEDVVIQGVAAKGEEK